MDISGLCLWTLSNYVSTQNSIGSAIFSPPSVSPFSFHFSLPLPLSLPLSFPLPPSLIPSLTLSLPPYRCMLIDNSANVIAHPRFFSEPSTINSHHLSAFEPFLMRDMYQMGYVQRIYCNNFQYNYEFTKRPRKQFSYEVTNKVRKLFCYVA